MDVITTVMVYGLYSLATQTLIIKIDLGGITMEDRMRIDPVQVRNLHIIINTIVNVYVMGYFLCLRYVM